MNKTLAYIRASTDQQDAKNQRHEILEYINKHKTSIDKFIEITISSRKNSRQRRIEELTNKLNEGDTLIVSR
ncbi:recombinase family protein [Chloroflexi bacterium TSY]|nr:recombinase family protein [Chloroflexi bacterium TSY]